MPDKPHVIVGTAGHIDHGKSALVKALTGTDPDTLPEEKLRGMTIELGFVFLEDPAAEKQVVFIDVPGHERFIRTMAAGASHVDAALFVIAADEGIAVQTREHFDILQLLGIRHGFIALTKSDLASEDRLRELTASVRNFVRGTFLDGAPVIPVSAVTGAGLDDIRTALGEISRRVEPREDTGIFRMPVDRVFTMRGFGTVIAGTVLSGEVRVGDRVVIYPEGLAARVRGVQVHREKRDFSRLGQRTALNLQDVKKEMLRRGQCAAAEDSLVPTIRLDARLELLRSAERELKHRERVRLHIGTDEVMARLVILADRRIEPGGSGFVQLILESPTVALPGDRFVIRSFSPLVTIGGGTVLDAAPEKHRRFDSTVPASLEHLEAGLDETVEHVVLQAGGRPQDLHDVALRLGKKETEVRAAAERLFERGALVNLPGEKPERVLHASVRERLAEELVGIVTSTLERNPHLLYVPFSEVRAEFLKRSDAATLKEVLDDLVARNILVRKEAHVGLAGREVRMKPRDQELADKVAKIYIDARFASPLEEDVRKGLDLTPALFKTILASLYQQGLLVRLAEKVTYHRDTLQMARDLVVEHIGRHGAITIAELRDRLKLSRKYAQAILEHFDETGLTRRVEDRHVLRKNA